METTEQQVRALSELQHFKTDDSKWTGRWGYDCYFVEGTEEEAKEAYKELRPHYMQQPKLEGITPVEGGIEMRGARTRENPEGKYKTKASGHIIKISRWAV